jgi:23S rRNA (uridine2552-2'-O)-methyltransferase
MADYKKPDHWQLKARKEGYPARSVYKLKEIDEKFGLFKGFRGDFRVLDLGAAPGSWSLYVLREILYQKKTSRKAAGAAILRAKTQRREELAGRLVAVDLGPLSREFDGGLFDSSSFCFIQGDITSEEVRKEIVSKGPYSVIISDAAPATTGNNFVDAARSLELAEEVVRYAENALAPGGKLVLKVFQGGDSGELLKKMKTLFEKAQSYKPQACRGESVETYFVGMGKL